MYLEFNNYIKDEFFSVEYTGETILFSVDESVINRFIEKREITYHVFQENIRDGLSYSWSSKTINRTQCFGICALQIYVAHQMSDDNKFSSQEYNPRLAQFLNIDTNKLQKLYSESQNDLWGNLRSFCDENSFRVNIPLPTYGKGCYVQYPFSQTLLNKEDLKKAPILFERVGIKKNEYLLFEEFSNMIEYADNSSCMSNHYYKVKDKLIIDFDSYNQLFQQLYNYFINEWDGFYLNSTRRTLKSKIQDLTKETLTFVLECNLENISVYNFDYDHIKTMFVTSDNVFQQIKDFQELYVEEFLMFETDCISKESSYVRKFEIGKQYVLVCKKRSSASKFIASLTKVETLANSHYDIFITGILSKKPRHLFWSKYFSFKSRNYKIQGGLKLNHKTWMIGCGPQILLDKKSKAWLNGKIITDSVFNCSELPAGNYRLKVDGFPPEKFKIEEPKYNVSDNCNGWVIEKKNYLWVQDNMNTNLVGLFCDFTKNESVITIRSWIKGITQDKNKTIHINRVVKEK